MSCLGESSSLLEIHTWGDQRELEQFITKINLFNPVWLDGYVMYSVYRPATIHLQWTTFFFPKLRNFKYSYRSPSESGMCVVIDPRDKFYWFQKPCEDVNVSMVCVKRRWTVSDYDPTQEQRTVTPIPDAIL